MNRATRSFLFALFAFVAATWLMCSPRREASAPLAVPAASSAPSAPASAAPAETSPPPSAPAQAGRAPATPRGIGFRNAQRLAEHFAKHGHEFDAPSASAYLALAQALRDAPVGGDVLEIRRPSDGVVSRFDRRSGAFLAFDSDGTIRTFFRPNDGESYFRRQARRAPQ
jgi:hypothetical protein